MFFVKLILFFRVAFKLIFVFFSFLVISLQAVSVKDFVGKSKVALMNCAKNKHAIVGHIQIDILTPRLDSNVNLV